ncbi:response regulator [Maribacter sp. 2307ULW6-5]|uniref:response regulator transcription factor n=1 Tax=Maribacter sp. 2307ULW6-5 TaxID=3386275 RepID=UPI0039BCF3A1
MALQSPSIMVVERTAALHETYKAYFARSNAFRLTQFCTSAALALKSLATTRPRIIVSEMTLEDMDGLQFIAALRKKDRDTPVVVVSANKDFELIKKTFKYGAQGFLTKPLSEEKLQYALRCVLEDGAVMSNDIIKRVISNFQHKTYAFLSQRENEIVDYLCKGDTYKMIAEKLFVTPSTINFHIQNIYLKLNVNSKSEALTKLRQL